MEFLATFIDIVLHLDKHLQVLIQNYGVWIYAILFLIIFCETGLVVAQIHAIGNRSLLIILASGMAVGFVLALQMYYALVTYGAAESLGLVYAVTTFLLGMVPLEHEYKLMGMAPYADAARARRLARLRLRGKPLSRLATVLLAIAALGIGALGILSLYGLQQYNSYTSSVVPPEQLLAQLPRGGARIYDRNGVLLYEFLDEFGGLRRPVPLDRISPYLRAAAVSTEPRIEQPRAASRRCLASTNANEFHESQIRFFRIAARTQAGSTCAISR